MRDRLQALLTSPVVSVPLRVVGRLGCRHEDEQWVRVKDRLFLRCTCGRETVGIRIESAQAPAERA